MVDRIGEGPSQARSAIESALRRHADAVARAKQSFEPAPAGETAQAQQSGFSNALVEGIKDVDAQVKRADSLVEDVVAGRVRDFHEVAAALKQSELSLKFALEVRNKFIDAYREIMRMSV
jgi:flagellar hook-basal body complex protein FliE